MTLKYSYNYMRGWNCAARGIDITDRFFDDDARRGYYGYLAAPLEQQVMFRPEDVRRAGPGMTASNLIKFLNKKEGRNANEYRAAWYERARQWVLRAAEMEAMLRRHREVFSRYAELHRAKGTRDGNRKAVDNAALADEIDELLSRT